MVLLFTNKNSLRVVDLVSESHHMKTTSFKNHMTLWTALIGLSFFTATKTHADDFSDRTDTVYLLTNYGLGTYKSKLVDSNDTMGVLTYGFGANAGQNKNLGIEYKVESQAVTFTVNKSSLTSVWTSTIFKYRLWAFELGPVIGNIKMTANRAGTDILDIAGNGYGGYFGILMPMGHNSLGYFNVTSVATADPLDKEARTISLGSRMDIELGGRIGITRKALDFVIGYRQRTNSVTEGGASYSELQTSTFLGFQVGRDF